MDTPVPSAPLRGFERIYLELGPLVRATLRARGVPLWAIDDLVHDVFLTAFRGRADRDAAVSLRLWFVGLARNAAFSYRRSAARRRRRYAALRPDRATEPLSAEELDARRCWVVLSEFLAELPARQREVFMLCHVARMPASELARLWGCTANTVHSRLRLARERFSRRFPGAHGVGDHEALLAAARREVEPPPERRRRAWALLVGDLTRPWWTSLFTAKTLGAAAIAVTASVGVARLGVRPAEHSDRPTPATTAAPLLAAAVRGDASGAPAPGEAVEPAVAQTADPKGPDAAAGVSTLPRLADRQRGSRPAVVESNAAKSMDAPQAPENGLQPELRVLTQARAQLRAGQATEALRLLRSHEQRFPDGILATERRRLRVDVLCRLGRVDEARSEIEALDVAAPARAAGRKAVSACKR